MSKYVERSTTGERVLHWFVTVSFFTLILSGAGLYSTLFDCCFRLFGGGQQAIFFHKFAGILFFGASIFMFFNRRKEVTTFDRDDKAWIAQRGGYLSREDIHFNMGKYNPRQKIFAIFIGVATVILGVSGIVIWNQFAFPRGVVQLSLMMHGGLGNEIIVDQHPSQVFECYRLDKIIRTTPLDQGGYQVLGGVKRGGHDNGGTVAAGDAFVLLHRTHQLQRFLTVHYRHHDIQKDQRVRRSRQQRLLKKFQGVQTVFGLGDLRDPALIEHVRHHFQKNA